MRSGLVDWNCNWEHEHDRGSVFNFMASSHESTLRT
jgi:hypothetical protein